MRILAPALSHTLSVTQERAAVTLKCQSWSEWLTRFTWQGMRCALNRPWGTFGVSNIKSRPFGECTGEESRVVTPVSLSPQVKYPFHTIGCPSEP